MPGLRGAVLLAQGFGDDPIKLVWHKTRWRCREPLCRRRSFTKSLPAVPARSRLTRRLRAEVGQMAADGMRCVQAACDRQLTASSPNSAW